MRSAALTMCLLCCGCATAPDIVENEPAARVISTPLGEYHYDEETGFYAPARRREIFSDDKPRAGAGRVYALPRGVGPCPWGTAPMPFGNHPLGRWDVEGTGVRP